MIDDYLMVALVDPDGPTGSLHRAGRLFVTAKAQYDTTGLRGSPAKEVLDQRRAVVLGAEVDARPCMVDIGHVPVGAPLSRRYALGSLTLEALRPPTTTVPLLSSLVGSWNAVFGFRRPPHVLLRLGV